MKHLILNTAGHIDHGKTALVKALTGLSRKFLIPLLAHFDGEKLTMRVGEKRGRRR